MPEDPRDETPGPATQISEPSRAPRRDPGSSRAAIIAWAVVIPLLLVTVIGQQLKVQPVEQPPQADAEDSAPIEIAPPAWTDTFTFTAKVLLKIVHIGQSDVASDAEVAGLLKNKLSASATTPADEVRLAVTFFELGLDEAAGRVLDDLVETLDDGSPLFIDADIVRAAYNNEPLPEGADDGSFVDRHAWFADLALTRGDASAHDRLLAGGLRIVLTVVFVAGGLLLVLPTGIALIVLWSIGVSKGKVTRRFQPPAAGGSVYLEMLPVFLAGFLVLQIAHGLIAGAGGERAGIYAALSMQWLLLAVLAWPTIRGVPWSRARRDLGFVAPQGLVREIGIGVLYYIALVPVLLFSALVAVVVMFFIVWLKSLFLPAGDEVSGGIPSNPILDMLSYGEPMMLAMFVLLATVWAPIVEEAVFRGALYRHLRSRRSWLFSALAVTIIFVMMHGYQVVQMIPLLSIGFVLVIIREWRGSIVSSMTAHLLHNAITLLIALKFFSAIVD